MIDHYILLKANFGDGKPNVSIDHELQHSGLGGIAYDTTLKKWITSANMTSQEESQDVAFLKIVTMFLSRSKDIEYGETT